jgi:putative hydrolase of the HAD superfamily
MLSAIPFENMPNPDNELLFDDDLAKPHHWGDDYQPPHAATDPQVIFFDAVGTLFGVRGSVGEVYGELARQHGVEVSAEILNQAFSQSFKAATPCAFAGADPTQITALEFVWWKAIVQQTFAQAGVLAKFTDFSTFFAELYTHFATAAPWFVYADVLPTLMHLQQSGITIGIVSNFDSRLYSVLSALKLNYFFSSVTISTEVGVAKPDRKIFDFALARHHCPAEAAWHIGDSLKEDYQAAKAAGLHGIWLNRK